MTRLHQRETATYQNLHPHRFNLPSKLSTARECFSITLVVLSVDYDGLKRAGVPGQLLPHDWPGLMTGSHLHEVIPWRIPILRAGSTRLTFSNDGLDTKKAKGGQEWETVFRYLVEWFISG